MPWLELRINSTRVQASKFESALMQYGALSVTLQDNADQPIFEPALGETPLWEDTCVTGLFDANIDATEIETALELPEQTHRHWHILEDKDWEREWMKHYAPIDCGNNFWICPSWIEPPQPEATNLMLDPGLAFGTGTHPTTFLCLQWLAQQDLKGKHVVDYGCGSGILGIGALLRGAADVQGIDIDPQALLATKENTLRNGLPSASFPVYFPDKSPTKEYDFVLANILAGPLAELAPTLCKMVKPGGWICLSGILSSQAHTVQSCYEGDFEFYPIQVKDEWVCLTGFKRR